MPPTPKRPVFERSSEVRTSSRLTIDSETEAPVELLELPRNPLALSFLLRCVSMTSSSPKRELAHLAVSGELSQRTALLAHWPRISFATFEP